MAVAMKIAVLWVDIYGRFGGTYCLHLLGRGVLSDLPLNIKQCKWSHIPEDGNFNTFFL
jgi:hypothetical protein